MGEIAIRVNNLGKRYRIGVETHGSLVERLRALARLNGRLPVETIWALKDVSFEVQHGEVLGVIGRNGAGKSTLLKILSRITEPTEGRAEIHGRVGSLLEVGTGFHPELTGRENVYLNGAIMGMRKTEIDRTFDEIVDFSGVEKFIDTPVKRYSSGMYVRLAFAVAAHLEPEILLVDEVLAVGDAAFQKKCLGKMGDVAKEGRTVLFVSHNMGAVAELCSRVILLRSGRIATAGSATQVISKYLQSDSDSYRVDLLTTNMGQTSDGSYRLAFLETRNQRGDLCSHFSFGETITVRVGVFGRKDASIILGIGVRDSLGRQILHFNNKDDRRELRLREGLSQFELRFENCLNSGEYYVSPWAGDTLLTSHGFARDCLRFSVDTSSLGSSFARGLVIQSGSWCSIS